MPAGNETKCQDTQCATTGIPQPISYYNMYMIQILSPQYVQGKLRSIWCSCRVEYSTVTNTRSTLHEHWSLSPLFPLIKLPIPSRELFLKVMLGFYVTRFLSLVVVYVLYMYKIAILYQTC